MDTVVTLLVYVGGTVLTTALAMFLYRRSRRNARRRVSRWLASAGAVAFGAWYVMNAIASVGDSIAKLDQTGTTATGTASQSVLGPVAGGASRLANGPTGIYAGIASRANLAAHSGQPATTPIVDPPALPLVIAEDAAVIALIALLSVSAAWIFYYIGIVALQDAARFVWWFATKA